MSRKRDYWTYRDLWRPRRFAGLPYSFLANSRSKRKCQEIAKAARKSGGLARVVKVPRLVEGKRMWAVYQRGSRWPR
jgi:hypothetical protein